MALRAGMRGVCMAMPLSHCQLRLCSEAVALGCVGGLLLMPTAVYRGADFADRRAHTVLIR